MILQTVIPAQKPLVRARDSRRTNPASSDIFYTKRFIIKIMKSSRLLLVVGALALPLACPAAQTLKDDARETWDGTKHAAVRTGEFVENGAVKSGRALERGVVKTGTFVERGAVKTGTFVENGLAPIGERLRGTPRITVNEDRIAAPNRIPSGSDLIVRNTGDTAETFSISGHGVKDRAFVAPGRAKRLDLDLPRGNYSLSSSEGGMSTLRVR